MSNRGTKAPAALLSTAIRGAARSKAKKTPRTISRRDKKKKKKRLAGTAASIEGHAWAVKTVATAADGEHPTSSLPTVIGLYKRAPSVRGCKEGVFSRKSVESSDVTGLGLTESSEYHREHTEKMKGDPGERAILVQTLSSYEELEAHYPGSGIRATCSAGGFGENMLVDGLNVDTVCIGDRLSVIGDTGWPGLELVVTAPRRPCGSVDFSHSKKHRSGGVRDACASAGLAGFFCRPIGPSSAAAAAGKGKGHAEGQDDDDVGDAVVLGEMCVGDSIVRTSQPYPKWTVRRVSAALYSGWGSTIPYTSWYDPEQWENVTVPLSDDELAELASIAELAEVEWRDQIREVQRVRLGQRWSFSLVGNAIRKVLGW
eukprot:m.203683 g.203683  ORF g.203683 m.203683 type:complete len:372 (-) comp25281_c0_seq1:2460-3575(-)